MNKCNNVIFYLHIYRMVVLSVYKVHLVLHWTYDTYMSAIDTPNNIWEICGKKSNINICKICIVYTKTFWSVYFIVIKLIIREMTC